MSISFELLDKNCEDWTTIADQFAQVSWRAGKFLADKMYLNDFDDWEKVIVGKKSEIVQRYMETLKIYLKNP